MNCPGCAPDAKARGFQTYWTRELDDAGSWVWECINCGHHQKMRSRPAKSGSAAQLRAIKRIERDERGEAVVTDIGAGRVHVKVESWPLNAHYFVGPRGRIEKQ